MKEVIKPLSILIISITCISFVLAQGIYNNPTLPVNEPSAIAPSGSTINVCYVNNSNTFTQENNFLSGITSNDGFDGLHPIWNTLENGVCLQYLGNICISYCGFIYSDNGDGTMFNQFNCPDGIDATSSGQWNFNSITVNVPPTFSGRDLKDVCHNASDCGINESVFPGTDNFRMRGYTPTAARWYAAQPFLTSGTAAAISFEQEYTESLQILSTICIDGLAVREGTAGAAGNYSANYGIRNVVNNSYIYPNTLIVNCTNVSLNSANTLKNCSIPITKLTPGQYIQSAGFNQSGAGTAPTIFQAPSTIQYAPFLGWDISASSPGYTWSAVAERMNSSGLVTTFPAGSIPSATQPFIMYHHEVECP